MPIPVELNARREEILAIARRHGATHVWLFGSCARGDARGNSDVDLLVRFLPGRSLLDHVALQQDLLQLPGRKVDVVVDGGLSPYLKDRILQEAAAL